MQKWSQWPLSGHTSQIEEEESMTQSSKQSFLPALGECTSIWPAFSLGLSTCTPAAVLTSSSPQLILYSSVKAHVFFQHNFPVSNSCHHCPRFSKPSLTAPKSPRPLIGSAWKHFLIQLRYHPASQGLCIPQLNGSHNSPRVIHISHGWTFLAPIHPKAHCLLLPSIDAAPLGVPPPQWVSLLSLRQCFTSQPTSSFLSALALPFSILARANRVTHLALPHTSLWHLLISNNKDHLMSIKELKLVPNIHSYSGFTHKGDGKRWIYSSARPGLTYNIEQSHREDLSSH